MPARMKCVISIFKWILIAYAITFILIFLYAAILTFTSVSESTMPMCVLIISMLSILIASSLSVKKEKEKGLVNGAIIGLSYILIMYLLSSIFVAGFSLNAYSIWTIVLCIFMGALGGIIGVNI